MEAGIYQPNALLPPVPRLQILTIEELLAGKKLEYPDVAPTTFRKAPRRTKAKPAAALSVAGSAKTEGSTQEGLSLDD